MMSLKLIKINNKESVHVSLSKNLKGAIII